MVRICASGRSLCGDLRKGLEAVGEGGKEWVGACRPRLGQPQKGAVQTDGRGLWEVDSIDFGDGAEAKCRTL